MSTKACYDYRRVDERVQILANPYWFTSAVVPGVTVEDGAALLISFPNPGEKIVVHDFIFEVVSALTASTVITVGIGTLATNAITTGGVVTDVTADNYILTTDITPQTPGFYIPVAAHTSAWLTAKVLGSIGAAMIHTGAATTVPCVCAYASHSSTILAGTFRVHMLLSRMPETKD